MKVLLLLAAIFLAAAGLFVVSGLPAIERLRRAHANLEQREQDLARMAAQEAPISHAEFDALAGERDRLAHAAQARFAALTAGTTAEPRAALEIELAQTHLGALGPDDKLTMAVKAQGATSPEAGRALAAIVRALSGADGVEVEALALKNDARLQPVPGVATLSQMEAQLVLTAGTPEALSCLEALVPERGTGLPVITVESSSLRRIEPERWGGQLQRFSGPPVRLSVSLAILFAASDGN